MPPKNIFSFKSMLLVFGILWKLSDTQVNGEEANQSPDGPRGDGSAFYALQSCQQLLQSNAGEFFSPDYLCSNPPLWCNWTIQVDPAKRILLQLEDQTPDDACHLKEDQVYLDEPIGHLKAHKVLEKCWREVKYMSSSNTVYVVQLIGGWPSSPYRGFHGRYQAFGPLVVYNPQEGFPNRESEPSPGILDFSELVKNGEQLESEHPSQASSDLTYDYFSPSSDGTEPEEAADTEVDENHHQVSASTQGTSRSGRGATKTSLRLSDSAVPPASSQQQRGGQSQEPLRPAKGIPAANVEESSTHPGEASSDPEEALSDPEEASSDPEEASSDPEEASSDPEEASSDPEEASSDPEEASSDPEEASSDPEEASSDPETASSAPEEASSAPEEASSAPETALSDPETASSDPEEASSAPETASSDPETASSDPETASSAPEEASSAPEEASSAPEEASSAPEEASSAPEEASSAPEEASSAPEEASSAPEEASSAPETASSAPETASSDPEEASSDPETASPDPETASSAPEEASSDPETASPDPETASPDPETASSAPETASSAPETASSAPETASSAPEEASSAPEEASSAPETASSAPEEASSAPETASSAPETASSAPETASSAPEEASSAPETASPDPEEAASPEEERLLEEEMSNWLPYPSEAAEPEETEPTLPQPNVVEPLSDHRGNIHIRNHSEDPHLPGDHLFEVTVEVKFIPDVKESWDNVFLSLLPSVKELISKQLKPLHMPLSMKTKRKKRLSAGGLYIIWLQIGQGPEGLQVHQTVHSNLHGLPATAVGVSQWEAVISSVSIADVNECGTQMVLCDVNADCVNQFGSYSCHCRPGFRDESRLGSGGTACVDEKPTGCSSALSPETKGVYGLFFLLSSLILLLLAAAGLLYHRHRRGAFLVRCHSGGGSSSIIVPPDLNNNNHHRHHCQHYDETYSITPDSDLPPPPPPVRSFREGWPPAKERWPPAKERSPALDLQLLRISQLLRPDACTEPQEGGKK
ncbi:mucin-4 isoform X2 [Perca flavescens]|uniref:mucin-4 isoform X2 n=1 Tax=Perca flavescens TaxID=8167 RepID=UPI00106DF5A8|nr:mucin-4-like isoform X2 [Perca flavescens]